MGFLGVNTLGDPKRDPEAAMNAAVDVSEARMIELVRAGVGVPDLAGAHRWLLALAGDRRSRAGNSRTAACSSSAMPRT